MTETGDVNEERLQAYVDGQLDPAERAEFEALLRADPAAAENVCAYQAQKQALRSAFEDVLTEPIPERLRAPRSRPSAAWRAVAAVALLLAGGAGGWFANDWLRPPPPRLAQTLTGEAVVAHRVYTKEVRHAVEVAANEEAHLVAWLSKRLDAPLAAPDLTKDGYSLVGGRLLPTNEGAAAHLMYENSTGDRLTLYVRTNRGGEETAFRFVQDGAVGAFYWLDGPLGYALLAEADRGTLLPLARAVYDELNP